VSTDRLDDALVGNQGPVDDSLVLEEKARVALIQVKRVPLLLFLVDLGCAAIAWQAGAGPLVWWWLAAITIVVKLRSVWLMRLASQGMPTSRLLAIIAVSMMLQGLVNSLIVPLVAVLPDARAHYAISVIMIGLAAGAMAPAAGHLPIYMPWAIMAGSVLGGSWWWRGTQEGYVFAFLLVALIVLLAGFVRDQGVSIKRLVATAENLRRSRDRAELAHAQAEAARQQANLANQARTRFFASASHDLRQPLHALSISTTALHNLASQHDDDRLTGVSGIMRRALAESKNLLDSLLEISELDAGAIHANRQPMELGQLFDQIRHECAAAAEEKGLVLTSTFDASLALQSGWYADADPWLLKRILLNLVGNAIKFTPGGSVNLSAALDPTTGSWHVRVRDTGPGIAQAEREKVFEEFYQLGNPHRDRKRGLGLGLPIVRRLAGLMGATVQITHSSNLGTTFEVCLPAIQQALPPPSTASEATAPVSLSAFEGKGYRILVIDDEQEVRTALHGLFTAIGWLPCVVADGPTAIATLDQGWQPDGIMVDYRLHADINGLDVLQALRNNGCQAPAVLVTGDTSPDRIAAAQASGLPILYKPVDGVVLVALLDRLCVAARRSEASVRGSVVQVN
jgi:two-component system, sensor histidine kinase